MSEVELLTALIQSGTPAKLVAQVAQLQARLHALEADVEATRKRREADVERKRLRKSAECPGIPRNSWNSAELTQIPQQNQEAPQGNENGTTIYNTSLTSLSSLQDSEERKEERKKVRGVQGGGATRLDPAWCPTEGHYALGAERGMSRPDVDGHAEAMRDWAAANAHRPVGRKTCWDRTFNNWLRNARSPPQRGWTAAAPRPGSREDTRERTINALRALAPRPNEPGGNQAGSADIFRLLPNAKSA